MPPWMRHISLSQSGWLLVGAFCACVSLMIGYHQDQQTAERAMVQKGGLPDQVSEPVAFEGTASDTDAEVDQLRRSLMALGLLIAIGSLAAPLLLTLIEGRPKRATGPMEVPAAGAFPAIRAFQPIATQDELRREETLAAGQSPVRDCVARLGSVALRRFGRIRSRR